MTVGRIPNIEGGIQPTLLTTTGDIMYASSASNPARLGIGTTNQVLKVTGGVPAWGTAAGGNLTETVFTSSNATYTIPTGVTGIWALCVGSGGGGGASSNATAQNAGGGGGAGQAIEKFIAIVGDTTLNITVPAGGAGGSAGGRGSSGSAATIVGNTSATTYLSAEGGGGGGGGAAAVVTGIPGASGGGNGSSTSVSAGGGGGGMATGATGRLKGLFDADGTTIGGGAAPTTAGVTGYTGGTTGSVIGGMGINIFNRQVSAGGTGGTDSGSPVTMNFGVGATTANTSNGSSASANTGSGGNAGKTLTTTNQTGGAGGSGLVILRYVV